MAMSATRTGITELGTVGVSVAAQDRALAFYVGTLGFETRLDAPFGEGRWIEVAPRGAATTLALVAAGGGALAAGLETGIRLTTRDAGRRGRPRRAAGAGRRRRPGGHAHGRARAAMFGFRDPDGNRLLVVQRP
jgi:catechol 2,3-dioxygenase-like lactoylglutathione lyase family enzyme